MSHTSVDWKSLIDKITADAPFGWVRCFVNFEIAGDADDMVSNYVAFYVKKTILGKLIKQDVDLGVEGVIIAQDVGVAIMNELGTRQLTYDIILSKDRTFKFFLDKGEPLRLSGALIDHEKNGRVERYKKYIDQDDILKSI